MNGENRIIKKFAIYELLPTTIVPLKEDGSFS